MNFLKFMKKKNNCMKGKIILTTFFFPGKITPKVIVTEKIILACFGYNTYLASFGGGRLFNQNIVVVQYYVSFRYTS